MANVKAKRVANAAAGSVGIWSARVLHAATEGCAYVCTVPGFRTVLAVHGIAICYYLGPSRTASLTFKCAVACAGYKFCEVLVKSAPAESEQENLESVWDWTPPGDLGGSGAWTVVRELALTLSRVNEEFPELQQLQPLPLTELASRLCHLFSKCAREPPAADLSACAGLEPVTGALLQKLAGYLYLADQSYEGQTEAQLSRRLERKGYALNYVKLTSTWADHQPAFFMATQAEAREVVVAIRGTAQLEDVVTDLTALPEVFGDTGMLAHSGMQRAALWLFQRLSSLLRVVTEAGYRVSVTGHSLGAGTAALLTILLHAQGIKCQAYAFAPPACAAKHLAAGCRDYVTSVAVADDIITRFSPGALVRLHGSLADMSPDEIHEDDLSPELQAITRIIGALQAMQNMRLPAALGGSKPEEAEARTSRAEAGAGGAQSRGRGSSEAEDAEGDKSSGKEGAGGSRSRDMGGSMAGDMEGGRDSEACAGGKDGCRTRGSKAGDAVAGQSSSKGGDEGSSKAEVADTGQSGGKGAGGGEAREEGAGGEEAAESAQVDEKSPESYEPCMPGRVLYIERLHSGATDGGDHAGSTGEGSDGEGSGDKEGCGRWARAVLLGEDAALADIRVTSRVVSDHLTATYYEALGCGNLTQEAERAEEEEAAEQAAQGPGERKVACDGEEDSTARDASGAQKDPEAWKLEEGAEDEADGGGSPGSGTAREVAEEVADKASAESQR